MTLNILTYLTVTCERGAHSAFKEARGSTCYMYRYLNIIFLHVQFHHEPERHIMSLPVGVCGQRSPRSFPDVLLATVSLGPPLAEEGTATRTKHGIVKYVKSINACRHF